MNELRPEDRDKVEEIKKRVLANAAEAEKMKNGEGVYANLKKVMELAHEYRRKTQITKDAFAKALGVSRPLLTQYLDGKYKSNPENVETKIMQYLRQVGFVKGDVEISEAGVDIPDFIPSNDALNILGVCKNCQERKGLGVIVGESGYGKTHTLKKFAESTERVAYLECEDSMRTLTDLVTALERVLGLPRGVTTVWNRVDAIKEFFRVRRGYLLILDEADKLINKGASMNASKAEILRAIFDQSPVGLVLAGEPALESKMKGYIPRLANRVDYYYNLTGVTKKEVFDYLEEAGLNYTVEAKEEMYKRATNSFTGCFRLLARTMKNLLEITQPGQLVDIDMIIKASGRMML